MGFLSLLRFVDPAEKKWLNPPYVATCVAPWRVQTYIQVYLGTQNVALWRDLNSTTVPDTHLQSLDATWI